MTTPPPDFIPDDQAPDFISDDEMAQASAAHTHDGRALPAGPTAAELSQSAPPPDQGSAVGRFFEPVGHAIAGAAQLPVFAGRLAKDALSGNAMGAARTAGELLEPNFDQARRAKAALESGNTSEGLGRAAAAAVPIFGPQVADIGDAVGEGNYAGALGQAAVLAAPMADFSKALPDVASRLLKRQAAKRIVDSWKLPRKAARTAEDIALDVAQGTPGRQLQGGIGYGTRKTLSTRAAVRSDQAGQAVDALQSLTTPVGVSGISGELENRAAGLETVTPTGEVLSGNAPLAKAYRSDEVGSGLINAMDQGYGGVGAVPAGELFKQRSAIDRRIGKSHETLPGQEPSPTGIAGKATTGLISDELHDEAKWGTGGLGGSKVVDREYRVWKNASTNFERTRLADLTDRGWRGLRDLLVGRAAGVLMGGAAGMHFGPVAGVSGALIGAALGESAFWQTLRAHEYIKLANLLNTGDTAAAANVLQKAAATYAITQGVKERERNRRAHEALRTQAEGVVAP